MTEEERELFDKIFMTLKNIEWSLGKLREDLAKVKVPRSKNVGSKNPYGLVPPEEENTDHSRWTKKDQEKINKSLERHLERNGYKLVKPRKKTKKKLDGDIDSNISFTIKRRPRK